MSIEKSHKKELRTNEMNVMAYAKAGTTKTRRSGCSGFFEPASQQKLIFKPKTAAVTSVLRQFIVQSRFYQIPEE